MGPEDLAAEFVLREPGERVEELARMLVDGQIVPGITRVRLAQRVTLGRGSLDRMMELLGGWRAEGAACF